MPPKIDAKYLDVNRRMDEVIGKLAPGETLSYYEIEKRTGYSATAARALEARALKKLMESKLKHWA